MRLSSFVLWVFILSSCGPMNKEKPAISNNGGGDTQATPQSLKGVNATKQNLFLVYLAQQKSDAKPEVGDNVYSIRIVNVSNLQSVSDQAKLAISYWMPEMPAMGKTDVNAIKQEDGTYEATLFFSMLGKWQMTLTIQDESKKDDYVFETTL